MSALLPLLPLLLLAGPAAAYRYDACEFQGNRFRCLGRCIGRDFVCDGAPDCDDKSDERRGCYECSPRAFRCDNKCLSLAKRCDGTEHCSDGSDEKGCPAKSSQFTCGDGSTVATSQVCDGYRDCLDDEAECTACRGGAFFCGRRCVPPGRVCDGYRDCEAGEDERDCAPDGPLSLSGPEMAARLVLGSRVLRGRDWKWGDADGKPPQKGTIISTVAPSGWVMVRWSSGMVGEYRMGYAGSFDLRLLTGEPPLQKATTGHCAPDRHSCSGRCIARDFLCDGVPNCVDLSDGVAKHGVDLSDEQNCRVKCSPRAFRCAENGDCMADFLRCDGTKHCPGGSDEEQCTATNASRFTCRDNSTLLDTRVCDGQTDCLGDEVGCTACQGGAFFCGGKCKLPSMVCDGFWDCPGGEDERGCAPDGPGSLSGPEMAARLVLGSRVARGKDWKWGDVDGTPPGEGTVINPIGLHGWVGVRWDSGKTGNYRMGNDSRFDLRLLSEETPVRKVSARTCPADRHRCDDRCLARDFVCDGISHCDDQSDELDCDQCSARALRCEADGKCVYGAFRCDGASQCLGGTDEKGCPAAAPQAPRFTCRDNSTVMPGVFVCDGYRNCPDGEDESGCTACQGGSLFCSDKCIPSSRVCDGLWDCRAGDDERDCAPAGSSDLSGPEMAARLVLGSRVARGRDWKWGDVDGVPPGKGTVTKVISLSGWAGVRWDSGKVGDYRMGNGSRFDLRLLTEEPPVREAATTDCPLDRHSCGGRCIAKDFVCDGQPHCNDNSDELDCEQCSPRAFRCEDGQCIFGLSRCDGVIQCHGGSDEWNCPAVVLNAQLFTCKDNGTRTMAQVCDGHWTCKGREDEDGCTSCQGGAFFCDGKCQSPGVVCDGFWDCPGGEDERDCAPEGPGSMSGPEMAARLVLGSRVARGKDWKWGDVDGTPPGEGTVINRIGLDGWVRVRWDSGKTGNYRMGNDSSFDLQLLSEESTLTEAVSASTCAGVRHSCNGRCIAKDFVCDGNFDCADQSDEVDCDKCSLRAFECEESGKCLHKMSRCDGTKHCSDGSDEKGCPPVTDSSRFTCKDNRTLDSSYVCNGEVTCAEREDEAECTACQGGAFHCSGKCVGPSKVCDGYWDCQGGEDERNCRPDGPGSLNGPTMAALLTNGSRVVRGKDWLWGEAPGRGTVTSPISLEGWVQVTWDNGTDGIYRMGYAGRFDLQPLTEELYSERSCGHTDTWTPLVVNGKEAPLGAVPWHAALYHLENKKYAFVCGASLITERYVLTAAHCITNADGSPKAEKDLGVALGKVFSDWYEDPLAQRHMIETALPSPNYLGNKKHFSGDIALLRLVKEVDFGSYIAPICVTKHIKVKENETIQVLGWGNGAVAHRKLASVGLQYQSEASCVDFLKNVRGNGVLSYVAADKFCGSPRVAEDPARLTGLAHGDSGGGAVINREGVWFLIGVVSISLPGNAVFGFTNMTTHYDWLMKVTNS